MQRFGDREKLYVAGLSSLAGFVDSVGFVQSKGFFVSFMSGNSTRLGVGLAGSLSDAVAALGLLTAFTVGVTAGTLVGAASARHRPTAVMATVAILLAGAALLGHLGVPHLALALIALAMGAENATFDHRGSLRVGLTYMTGSVVSVGRALAGRLRGSRDGDWRSPLLMWSGFILGAATGAFAAARFGFVALYVASAAAAGFALLARALPLLTATTDPR